MAWIGCRPPDRVQHLSQHFRLTISKLKWQYSNVDKHEKFVLQIFALLGLLGI